MFDLGPVNPANPVPCRCRSSQRMDTSILEAFGTWRVQGGCKPRWQSCLLSTSWGKRPLGFPQLNWFWSVFQVCYWGPVCPLWLQVPQVLKNSLQRIKCKHIRLKDQKTELYPGLLNTLYFFAPFYFKGSCATFYKHASNKDNIPKLPRFFNMKRSAKNSIRRAPSAISWVYAFVNLSAWGQTDAQSLIRQWNLVNFMFTVFCARF